MKELVRVKLHAEGPSMAQLIGEGADDLLEERVDGTHTEARVLQQQGMQRRIGSLL